MEKVSRYLLVFIAILTLAIILPRLYWMAFEKPVRKPFILYSCINDDFMIHRISEKTWEDTKGQQYTREEYEQKLPMMFLKQLLASGTMPDSVNGVKLDMRDIAREKSFFRLKANEIDAPAPALYPLFESQSGRAMLDLPDDFFRITWRIEFIDAATNMVLEEKSQLFSATLFQYGFSFPAKTISGLATPRKSVDEGYLIVDAKDQLFHLKMIKGKPYVKTINVPEGLKFKYISCVDFKNKDFYAYLFSDKNEIYILTQGDYELIKWPVEGFDRSNSDLKIYGDLFNFTVVIESENQFKVIALDLDYQVVDTYTETRKLKEEQTEGKIFASLFPAQVSMTSDSSKFIRFYVSISKGLNWIIFNLLLMAFHFTLLFKRKVKLKNHLADLGIVAVSGIFGLIAIWIFPNKFFD
ncbi:MAG TPA: hypothetical protein DHV48_01685 [Prolixibacteraceae bacterium]|nr:hypothetical protein [Prolixibacteraceae bacterium]